MSWFCGSRRLISESIGRIRFLPFLSANRSFVRGTCPQLPNVGAHAAHHPRRPITPARVFVELALPGNLPTTSANSLLPVHMVVKDVRTAKVRHWWFVSCTFLLVHSWCLSGGTIYGAGGSANGSSGTASGAAIFITLSLYLCLAKFLFFLQWCTSDWTQSTFSLPNFLPLQTLATFCELQLAVGVEIVENGFCDWVA